MMPRPSLFLAACAALLLMGCDTFALPVKKEADPKPVVNTCISLKTFTPAQQKEIAAAMRALSADSALISPLLDWARMRDATRACAAK